MSIPLPGTYKLRNVSYADQIFYLAGGAVAAGTSIIGRKDDKTQNMLWTLQVVDEVNSYVRLINVASGTFAQSAAAGAGTTVTGAPVAGQFMMVQGEKLGEYAIQTVDGNFACSLANNAVGTPVTMKAPDSKDPTQYWIFCPA